MLVVEWKTALVVFQFLLLLVIVSDIAIILPFE